jgi:hypothetical protein
VIGANHGRQSLLTASVWNFDSELEIDETMASSIEKFIQLLKKSPPGAVFNPWWRRDTQNDICRNASDIRRKQLNAYLQERLGKAKFALIGEAIGYRGGHFSGIPMTSERILLGKKKVSGIDPQQILCSIKPRRTSKPAKCPDGFSEPTATIVWSTLLELRLQSDKFVLWNAFPWHSFDPRRGVLSNRMPNKTERSTGMPVLEAFLQIFRCNQIIALGKISAAQLEKLNIDAHYVRHPASGGARLFRQQIAKALAQFH